jgi:GT2 family glycosyltransferase
MLSPIALFVYNRPRHTERTLEALRKNEAASESELFIFSDGPMNENVIKDVEDVRDIIRGITGFKNVAITERQENYGLARSIVEGVTEIVDSFGKVIVMEDDLVTSPFFLRYMNDALDLYHDERRVMHVSAGTYPIGDFCTDDTYFLRIPLCWGWGTWKRAWDKFDKKIEIMQQFNSRMISGFNFDGTYTYWEQLELNRTGKLNTWFVFWYAKVFLNNALVLFPNRSLVRNIGHDGSGVHCGISNVYDVELSSVPIKVSSIPIQESREAFYRHKQYFRSIYPGRYLPLLYTIIRIVKKFTHI